MILLCIIQFYAWVYYSIKLWLMNYFLTGKAPVKLKLLIIDYLWPSSSKYDVSYFNKSLGI